LAGSRRLKIILDTQVLIWWANDVSNISDRVQNIIFDLDNELGVSLASIWEIQIKVSFGKLNLPRPLPDIIAAQVKENQIKIMQIELSHIYTLDLLPLHHRDPFDRIIIAQSINEKMSIASIDQSFDAYSINRIW
jgi:PIN domain nuclease of toxin-antitoxin system